MKDSGPGTRSSVIDYATDVQASHPEPTGREGAAAKAHVEARSNSGAPAQAEKVRRCGKGLGLHSKNKM